MLGKVPNNRGRITGIFYFPLKHLLHTTHELSVLLVTDNTLAINNKEKRQTGLLNTIADIFKNPSTLRACTLFVGFTQAYLAHAQQISQLLRNR